MKKFVLGLIVGVAVTASSSAFADDIVQSIVGKKVDGEFPVKIAGKSLETQAATVEGTSYLPVRAIGEALNMDVKFDSVTGIELTRKGVPTVTDTFTPADKEALRIRLEIGTKLMELNTKRRKFVEVEISPYSNIVSSQDHRKLSEENFEYDDSYFAAKKVLEEKRAELEELDKQITDLQAQQLQQYPQLQ